MRRRPLMLCSAVIATLFVGSLPTFAQYPPLHPPDGLPSQPWPQLCHDAQRTSRSSIVGPQTATVKHVYDTPTPAGFFYFTGFTDITVARSGRAYIGIEHCFAYPEGCLALFHTICLLRPDGAARVLPIDVRTQYTPPVIGQDGTLYANRGSGLAALTPFGRVKWTCFGARIAALATDGTLYAYAGRNLVALDPAGTVTWSIPLPDDPFTPLSIGPAGDFYYGSVDRCLTALSPAGALKWRFFTGDQMHSPPAIGADGTIYAGGTNVYALSPEGRVQWTYEIPGMSFSGTTPALGADGTLYLPTTQAITALNPDGTQKWAYPRYGVGRHIIVGGDGTLYSTWFAGIYDTGILALRETGEPKWTFPLSYPEDIGFSAAPALGPDGTLYVATSYRVYAFGTTR